MSFEYGGDITPDSDNVYAADYLMISDTFQLMERECGHSDDNPGKAFSFPFFLWSIYLPLPHLFPFTFYVPEGAPLAELLQDDDVMEMYFGPNKVEIARNKYSSRETSGDETEDGLWNSIMQK